MAGNAIEIVGPDEATREVARAEWAMSSADWSRRAQQAAEYGNLDSARVFAQVARIADAVARAKS